MRFGGKTYFGGLSPQGHYDRGCDSGAGRIMRKIVSVLCGLRSACSFLAVTDEEHGDCRQPGVIPSAVQNAAPDRTRQRFLSLSGKASTIVVISVHLGNVAFSQDHHHTKTILPCEFASNH